MTPVTRVCGKCGTEIPADALEGGCPGCLLETALDATGEQILFGSYRLIKVLGRGGMGIVWLTPDDGTIHDHRRPRQPRQIRHRRAHVQRSPQSRPAMALADWISGSCPLQNRVRHDVPYCLLSQSRECDRNLRAVRSFRRRLRLGSASFILDRGGQRVYERFRRQVAPHVPEAQEEIERKIGQSLPRSRLTKRAT
jgi:hypothetical protein